MVASIVRLTSGFDGAYFTKPLAADYYVGEEQERGEWYGGLADKLGLNGAVSADALKHVLAGEHPDTAKRLVTSNSPQKVPGVDITFSAPKSVSSLWAVSDPHTRKIIEGCVKEAVREQLSFIEENLGLVRKGRGGCIVENGKLVAALFPHFTNRNGEPDLHIHAVIANLALTGEGKIQRINTRELYEWTRTLGPMFRADLASRLDRALGLELHLPRDAKGNARSWFEVTGVPKTLCDAWSSRRKEIEQYLDSDAVSSARARAAANIRTRKSKDRLGHIDALEKRWREQAKEHGFGRERAKSLLHQTKEQRISQSFGDVVQDAVQQLSQSEAHFSYRDLLRTVTERVQHTGLSSRAIRQQLENTLAESPNLLTLEGSALKRRFTTREVWRLEKEFLRNVDALQRRKGATVSTRVLSSVLKNRPELSSDQAEAVEMLTQGKESIRLLRGVAGAGKSYTLDAVREAFSKSGYHVIGGALSAVAKEELAEQSKIPSRTVASYLYHLERTPSQRFVDRILRELKALLSGREPTQKRGPVSLGKKTVLVLDEAGMLDTRSLNRLLRHAVKAKATVILVGDDKQLQPIEAGGPFHHLLKKLLPATLTENRRQQHEEDRSAIREIREGKARQALKNYEARGRLTVGKSRRDTIEKLVQQWTASGGATNPKEHVVFTETRAEANEVNRRCQAARLASSGASKAPYVERAGQRFYVGDRVLFHAADRIRGIENGYRGAVVRVDRLRKAIHVRLDRPKEGRASVVQLPLSSLAPESITLGYASTTHKMQGQTIAHSYVLLGGVSSSRNMAYTQVTRGKQSTKLFIDRQSAGEDLQDIAYRIAKERPKTMAHDHVSSRLPDLDRR